MASPNLGYTIPPFGTPSPTYANNINAAFTTIDLHDHSSGKGVQLTPPSISINADLPFNSYGGAGAPNNATGLRSTRFVSQSATLALSADKTCVYSVAGDLWYNNAGGTAVQITSGSGIYAVAAGGFGGDYISSGAAANYVNATSTYKFFQPGGTLFASAQTGQIYSSTTIPGIAFDDTDASAYAFRWGVHANGCVLSGDTTGTRSQRSDGHYTDKVVCLESLFLGTGKQPCLGVGITPANAALQVWTTNAGGIGPMATAVLQNASNGSWVLVQGVASGTTLRSAYHSYYDGTNQTDVGTLSTAGAAITGGSAGDFAIRVNSSEVFVIRAATGGLGLGGQGVPANILDVRGSAVIGAGGGYAGNAAPSNGLMVQGSTCIGTTANNTTGGLTVGGNVNPAANNSQGLGTSSFRFTDVYSVAGDFSGNVNAGNVNAGTVVVSSYVVPSANNTNALGLSGTRWSNVWSEFGYFTGANYTPASNADLVVRHAGNAIVAAGSFSSAGVASAGNWNCTANATGGGNYTVTLNQAIAAGCAVIVAAQTAASTVTGSQSGGSTILVNTGGSPVAFSLLVIGAPAGAP